MPWTPQRVFEMNAYYDVYVKWAVLILAFMVSCNYVTDSHLWMHLKTGQLIAEGPGPVMTDVFSYTENGRPWVNNSWLFDWMIAACTSWPTAWSRSTPRTPRPIGPARRILPWARSWL